AQLVAAETLNKEVNRYLDQDGVLFWYLGEGGLAAEQVPQVAHTAQLVHAIDPRRPLAADVWDGFQPFSRSVNLLGVHRWPLMTGLELSQYREWLEQRRLLANSNPFLWTWVQTHLPDWYANLIYDHPGATGFDEPIGPQPEQIRLLTYTALAAGCRGVGFWSDRFLADSHQGRDRLLSLALLNQEIHMLERVLVEAKPDKMRWIDTSNPDVKAAVIYTDTNLGVLVLPIWMGKGSQFVPGQAAAARLSMVVPDVPVGTQAWEVSPADVRGLRAERVTGGMKVTVPEFGMTSAIVFTSDNGPDGLLVQFQEQTRRMRKLAAQWAHDLAQVEMDKVLAVYQQLEQAGRRLPDAQGLLDNARARLQSSANLLTSGDPREAYHEAQRAVRPLRILMRAYWDSATKDLDAPVASPYAVSFFTLPRHYRFMEKVGQSTAATNVLPGGDFEMEPSNASAAWLPQEVTLDQVDLLARRVANDAHEGRQCLMLQIKPKNKEMPIRALERTFLAIHSPAVRLQPGTLVRVSGWVRIPENLTASADGALLYDSAGGEPLAIRLIGATKWKKFTLYRNVPASGLINVSVALTGIGTAFFDDIRIEPMYPGAVPGPLAGAAASR
ncbi:MAG TPA: hypothetical protein VKH44_12035, partial [Pirellulaceae bacterium]|nr:hypothetical protein [Pirellulaceae bacterium]